MKDKAFVDSNIWCYAVDDDSGVKQTVAQQTIHRLTVAGSVVISTQVLNEVFNVATRRLKISPIQVKGMVRNMIDYEVVVVGPEIIELAIDFSILEQISYWDALMLAAAYKSNCRCLVTEDLNHGQTIQGIQIVNPFLS